jgi:hypothetical protein
MYQTSPEVQIHSWKNSTAKQAVPILELNPDNLLSLIAPKVTTIVSYKMFNFSIRVSLRSGPGRWINNPIAKQTLQRLHVDVNISKPTSDSGETIETSGYLFFESSNHTHRHHNLKNLRSGKLPSLTSDTTGKHQPDKQFHIWQLRLERTTSPLLQKSSRRTLMGLKPQFSWEDYLVSPK